MPLKTANEPPPVDPPEAGIVHYGPGARLLCGDESPYAVYTDDPHQVAGCEDCLELVAEDLQDPDTRHRGYCLHCSREITATGSVEWRRVGPATMPALRTRWVVNTITSLANSAAARYKEQDT